MSKCTIIYIPDTASPPSFQFQGSPTLVLGAFTAKRSARREKLKRGGLADEVELHA